MVAQAALAVGRGICAELDLPIPWWDGRRLAEAGQSWAQIAAWARVSAQAYTRITPQGVQFNYERFRQASSRIRYRTARPGVGIAPLAALHP